MFVLPFFLIQFFLGMLGMGVFFYLLLTKTISNYLLVTYSLPTNVPLLTLNSFFITPSFLDYLGIVLFVISFVFTLFVLSKVKETALEKQNFFHILFYSIFYLSVYPFIAINGVYNYFKRQNKW
jgi:hypothetical protein